MLYYYFRTLSLSFLFVIGEEKILLVVFSWFGEVGWVNCWKISFRFVLLHKVSFAKMLISTVIWKRTGWKTVWEKQLVFLAGAVLFSFCCNCPINCFVSAASFCYKQVACAYHYGTVIFRVSTKCKVTLEFLALEAFNSVCFSSMS